MASKNGKGMRGLRPSHVIVDEISEWNGDDTIVFERPDLVRIPASIKEEWIKANLGPVVAEELQHADKREGEINAES